MNKCFYLLLALALASCSSKKESESSNTADFDFSYTFDTVIVDADDEFLFLNMELMFSDYSAKEGLLYNLNPQTGRIEIIDLKNLRLEKLVQYDLDGPNSIKDNETLGIKKTNTGDLFVIDYFLINRFDTSKTKIASYRLDNASLNGDQLSNTETINGMGQIATEGDCFASFYLNYEANSSPLGVAKITFSDSTLKLIPLDFWGDKDKFEIEMNVTSGPMRVQQVAPEFSLLTLDGPNFIVSTTVKNELWYYDAALDSTFHKEYISSFTKNEKPGNYSKIADSMDSFEEAYKQKNDEVVFGPLVKDENSDRFYRYSRERNNSEKKYAYVLTIFDKKLNQLHEEKLREDMIIPGDYMPGGKTFVHQGNLYSFLNIDDEMAFVRLKPSFE